MYTAILNTTLLLFKYFTSHIVPSFHNFTISQFHNSIAFQDGINININIHRSTAFIYQPFTPLEWIHSLLTLGVTTINLHQIPLHILEIMNLLILQTERFQYTTSTLLKALKRLTMFQWCLLSQTIVMT